MLSIENSQASDPSFPPPLNTTSHDLPEVVLVDLPPKFDHHHTNFSIRDYVFTARSKDIKKNWPFSLKNLQLCLKHGVKDVLPPFQSLDTLKDRSIETCTVETTSLGKQNINNFDKEQSKTGYYAVGETSAVSELKNKLAGSYLDVSSCRSGEENELPSTITSACQSGIEFPPDNRQSSSLLDSDNLFKLPSIEVEAAGPPCVTNKSENTSKLSGKRCRLIVKFGGNSDRSSSEDIASNCTSISESMASKVCPVCKTFSSSSNTTLNAHIDQCLSVESTPKWVADSKLTRHRIKPRKMRMMVDIYETAPHCTLEDLDRRNGTNWATISSLPAHQVKKIENSNDGKRPRLSLNHPDDAGADVGPVYIDATGTKVRILSKFDDQSQVVKLGEVNETGKGGKYISKKKNKKKKFLAQKHQKHLNLASISKNILSHKVALATQVSTCREGDNGDGNSCKKEYQMTKQAKPSDAETFRPWVCSKPRDFTKKIAYKERHQPLKCKWHLPQNYLVESAQSVLNDASSERAQRLANRSERNVDRQFNETQGDNDEQSPARKVAESHSLGTGTRDSMIVRRSFQQTKQKGNQLSKSGKFMRDRCILRSPNSVVNYVSSLRKKMVNTCGDAAYGSRIAALASKKSSRSSHAIVNKALKFSSFRKNVLSVSSQSSPLESGCSNIKKWSTLKRSRVALMTDRNKELQSWSSEVDRQGAVMHQQAANQLELEETVDRLSLGGTNVRESIQERGSTCDYQREKPHLRKAKSTPIMYDPDEESHKDFGDDDLSCKQTRVREEGIVTEPSSKTSEGSAKSVETDLCELNYSSKANSNSLNSIENYGGFFCGTEASNDPVEPAFPDDPGMFSADEAGNGMSRQNTDMVMPLNSDDGQGNSFHVVDPIPIPGPPGSFLPSPRDMGSEDFQGNSSLTTSRVNSSPDQHDMIDGDSSDSPISASSTISNSTADRSDFKFLEPFSSAEPYTVQEKVGLGLPATNTEVPIQNAISFPQTSVAGERTAFEGQFLKIDRIPFDKGPLSYKNDQPCCCQRKERLSHGLFSNHQESQLLKRRKMASATISTAAKPVMSDYPRGSMEFGPESTSLTSFQIPGSGKIVLPTTKPTAICVPCNKDSPSAVARFAARRDCDSASPSASNPILRLMGKDLLVVSKDEDAYVPLRLREPHSQHNQQTSQVVSFSTASAVNPQNQDSNSFHHLASQGSAVFPRDLHATVGHCYDAGLSNSFRGQSDLRISQAHAQLPAGMFADLQMDRFAMSMEPNQYRGDYSFPTRPYRLKNGTVGSSVCNIDNVAPGPGQHVGSSAHAMKEIIIIDDVPERDSAAISDVARYTEGWRQHQIISSSGSIPVTLNRNQGCPHPPGEAPIICNASFHQSPTILGKSSPVRWGCTSDGAVLLPCSPFTTAPSSSSHIRSTTGFYSPSIS